MSRLCRIVVAAVISIVAAGCADGDNWPLPAVPTAPPSREPLDPPTIPVGSSTTIGESTNSSAATSVPGGSVSTTAPGGPVSTVPPPGSPAPPVSTLVPPVPGTLDPTDPNNQRPTPTPEEQAILNAYIAGSDALAAFYSKFPWNPNDPLIANAPFTDEVRATIQVDAAQTETVREVLDVTGGLTYRPYLVGYESGATEAFVFDCELDGSVWRNADTGEVVPPPNAGYANTGPEIATPVGLAAEMVPRDGVWLIKQYVVDGRACI